MLVLVDQIVAISERDTATTTTGSRRRNMTAIDAKNDDVGEKMRLFIDRAERSGAPEVERDHDAHDRRPTAPQRHEATEDQPEQERNRNQVRDAKGCNVAVARR
jgi:hypothetical protein